MQVFHLERAETTAGTYQLVFVSYVPIHAMHKPTCLLNVRAPKLHMYTI